MKNYFALILIVVAKIGFAQIPNNGFDTWTNNGIYQTPTYWDNLNQITYDNSIYTCVQGTPGYIGSSYLILTTKSVLGKGVVPARVVSGKIDTVTYKPIHGYPFANRPQTLTYNLQYMPYDPSDSSSVTVLLTKWNTTTYKRDTVAFGGSYYNAMAHSWFVGTTYLTYLSGENPDSAMIVISASSSAPKSGSYIYIDNLQFNGNVVGITENSINDIGVSVFPNPTRHNVTIKIDNTANTDYDLKVYDFEGKLIYEQTVLSNTITLNTSQWSRGFYNLSITNNNKILTKKLIIN
jgi:hypothetical protein